jgi:membrane-associated phospholipid phosphatase
MTSVPGSADTPKWIVSCDTANMMTTRQSMIMAKVAAKVGLALVFQMAPVAAALAQAPSDSAHVDKTFFTRRDAVLTGIAIVGTVAISTFDERIGKWTQTPSVQGSQARQNLFNDLTHLNETPLTIAAIATYGIGRLVHSGTVGDVGLHWTEAIVLNNVVSELIRGPIGRARPRVSQDNAYKFQFGGGFTKFEDRSFPSLHSSSAFATAAALVGEVHERNPGATWVVAPLLYGAACIPGLTRMYLNQHWASDVVAGAFVGTLIGAKVVHYAHTHRRTKLDRILLGTSIVPVSGGVALAVALHQ